MSQGRTLATQARARFLAALASTANVSAAAALVAISRQTAYRIRAADEEFRAAWDDAIEHATDALEAEARRRAMEGTEEFVTCRSGLVLDPDGRPVMQRRYSDTLMALLLRAHRPEKFRDRASIEHTGPGDGPVQLAVAVIDRPPPETREEWLARRRREISGAVPG